MISYLHPRLVLGARWRLLEPTSRYVTACLSRAQHRRYEIVRWAPCLEICKKSNGQLLTYRPTSVSFLSSPPGWDAIETPGMMWTFAMVESSFGPNLENSDCDTAGIRCRMRQDHPHEDVGHLQTVGNLHQDGSSFPGSLVNSASKCDICEIMHDKS